MGSTTGLPPGAGDVAVTVSTDRGEITLPLAVTPMPDDVVWIPANSLASAVRATLGAGNGDLVTVASRSSAAATAGVESA